MNVGELCIREVVYATPEEPIRDAAERMVRHRVGSLVVCAGDLPPRRPIGILTDRDLLSAVILSEDGHDRALHVRDLMSEPVVTAPETEGIPEALTRMREHGIRRLPIVGADGRLLGILAYDDLLEWIAETLDGLGRLARSQPRRERHAL